MSGDDNHLWLRMWRERRIDFHQSGVNRLLTRFWPGAGHPAGSRVFVPLCGKSLDMIWLAEQGHEVIGVELSPVAVKAFFKENGLRPAKRRCGSFTSWSHGRISILCGDFFSLLKADLGHIDHVYDRAALTALPEDVRRRYVAHLRRILPVTSDVFLLTTEDVDGDGPRDPAGQVDEEVAQLYAGAFDIQLAHVERVFEPDLDSPGKPPIQAQYKVYRMSGKVRLV